MKLWKKTVFQMTESTVLLEEKRSSVGILALISAIVFFVFHLIQRKILFMLAPATK